MKKQNNKKNYYIDRKELDELLKYHSEHYQDEGYKISEELGDKFVLISKNMIKRPNFSRYTYKTDFISDGIYDCVRYSKNYKYPGNSFAYLSMIIHRSMVRRIIKEKKIFNGKIKYIQNMTNEDVFNKIESDEFIDLEMFTTFKELYEKNLPDDKKEIDPIETSLTKLMEM